MNVEQVKSYFESSDVVEHYARAAGRVGLWLSEERIFTRVFSPQDSILELGCGAGRIAIGMYELGYQKVLATDYAKQMVQRAIEIARILEYRIPFHVADACALNHEDEVFDGAIFGFNGLMQIPAEADRERALAEIYRVLRSGAWFVFTTHDRDRSMHQDFWIAEKRRWELGQQSEELEKFGDRAERGDEGYHFMHVPTVAEIEEVLQRVGFRIDASIMRSELGQEPAEVTDFSDDCRFWVVQKM